MRKPEMADDKYIAIEESGLGVEFVEELSRLADLRDQIAALEAKARVLRESIQSRMLDRGVVAVRGAGYRVSVSVRERRSINGDKLVALGVAPDIIKRATDTSSFIMLDIRKERQ
jgi:hypothetical protein